MADSSVQIRIEDHSKEVLEELKRRIPVALEAVGIHLEGEAKRELGNSPVRIDTGLLRNSITHAISGEAPAVKSYHADHESRYGNRYGSRQMSGSYHGNAPNDPEEKKAVYIGTNVSYAAYVHEGFNLPSGKHIAPNHFLKNACERNKDQVRRYIENELNKE